MLFEWITGVDRHHRAGRGAFDEQFAIADPDFAERAAVDDRRHRENQTRVVGQQRHARQVFDDPGVLLALGMFFENLAEVQRLQPRELT